MAITAHEAIAHEGDARIPYDALVFEGGGILGAAYAAALVEARACGLIDVTPHGATYRFAGTSIGAAVAALLACRMPIEDLMRAVAERWQPALARDSYTECALRGVADSHRALWRRLARLLSLPVCVVRDAQRAYTRGGVWRGAALRAMFADEVARVTGNADVTLGEVHARYGTELVVCAYCVDTGSSVYFSHHTHAHMPLVTAVHASMAVPGMFEWVAYGGHRYWDGGLMDNLPLHVFDERVPCADGTLQRRHAHKGTLGFLLVPGSDVSRARVQRACGDDAAAVPLEGCGSGGGSGDGCGGARSATIVGALRCLVEAVVRTAQQQHREPCDHTRIVRIYTHDLGSFDFDAGDAERRLAESYGRAGVRAFCAKRHPMAVVPTTKCSEETMHGDCANHCVCPCAGRSAESLRDPLCDAPPSLVTATEPTTKPRTPPLRTPPRQRPPHRSARRMSSPTSRRRAQRGDVVALNRCASAPDVWRAAR